MLQDALYMTLRDAALVLTPDRVPGVADQQHSAFKAPYIAAVALVAITVEVARI